jgi:hypothetical protein
MASNMTPLFWGVTGTARVVMSGGEITSNGSPLVGKTCVACTYDESAMQINPSRANATFWNENSLTLNNVAVDLTQRVLLQANAKISVKGDSDSSIRGGRFTMRSSADSVCKVNDIRVSC